MRPGQFARVELVLSTRQNGLVVPVAAVRRANDRHYVFVLEGDQAIAREVEVGIRIDEWSEIRSGLQRARKSSKPGIIHSTLTPRPPFEL